MIVAAAIAPHGLPAFEPGPTRTALEDVGRRFELAGPEAIVVLTPHNVHVDRHFAVITAGKAAGQIDGHELEREVDRQLAHAILGELSPAVGVSYGGNDPATAEFPLDWGTEVPLEFVRPPRVLVVAPARDRPLEEHLRLGEAIAALPGRIALIASADNGHAHDPDGPYGFDPAAAAYDAQLQEILVSDRLDFLPLGELVEPAKADSLWQLLVLQGAVGESARADVLAYAAPTYYGMLVAELTP
jgi:aromatic ring-opening dioxygenase LigB subunit